ncbi:MAG: c-type cytochrome [Nitrospirota bacterium]|jgi:mono/diheme cytochrome c family protein
MGKTLFRGMVLLFAVLTACAIWFAMAAQAAEAGAENPFEGNAEAIAQGQELFNEYCSECHGTGTGGTGPDLTDAEWTYGGKDAEVYQSVTRGRPGGMPSMVYDMEKEEIWKTIAFIRSIKR